MDYFALFRSRYTKTKFQLLLLKVDDRENAVLYSQYTDKYVVNTGRDLIRSNNYILIKNE